MAMMARLSGKRARHQGPAASLAATVAAVAALAAPGVATATPPTPTITASPARPAPLTMQLTSNTGHRTGPGPSSMPRRPSSARQRSRTRCRRSRRQATTPPSWMPPTTIRSPRPRHAQTTFHVYATPTADFTYTALAGGTVQFTDTSTGEPTSWQWTFPGGATSSLRNPPPQPIAAASPPPTGDAHGGQPGRELTP